MGYRTYTCPIAKRCGGCEWLAVPYPIQLRRKQAVVEEQLGELVAHDDGTIASVVGMAEPNAYRHKCATPFAPGKGASLRSGFYGVGSHRIVSAPQCLVEHPLGRSVLHAVAHHAAKLNISAYHEDSGSGCLRHAIIRIGYHSNEALLTLVTNGRKLPHHHQLTHALMHEFPQLVGIVQSVNTTRGNAMLGRECHTLAGSATMHDALLGCTFEIGATSFYQTNPQQTETLYQIALAAALGHSDNPATTIGLSGESAESVGTASSLDADVSERSIAINQKSQSVERMHRRGGATERSLLELHACTPSSDAHTELKSSASLHLLDAYCGCGTIGICAAAIAKASGIDIHVTGVERVKPAITLARRNAIANGFGQQCSFVSADATAYLQHLCDQGRRQGAHAALASHIDTNAFARSDSYARNSESSFDVIVLDPPRAGSTAEFLHAAAALAPERIVYVSCNVITQARDLQVLRMAGYRIASVTPVDLFPHTKHIESVALLCKK